MQGRAQARGRGIGKKGEVKGKKCVSNQRHIRLHSLLPYENNGPTMVPGLFLAKKRWSALAVTFEAFDGFVDSYATQTRHGLGAHSYNKTAEFLGIPTYARPPQACTRTHKHAHKNAHKQGHKQAHKQAHTQAHTQAHKQAHKSFWGTSAFETRGDRCEVLAAWLNQCGNQPNASADNRWFFILHPVIDSPPSYCQPRQGRV